MPNNDGSLVSQGLGRVKRTRDARSGQAPDGSREQPSPRGRARVSTGKKSWQPKVLLPITARLDMALDAVIESDPKAQQSDGTGGDTFKRPVQKKKRKKRGVQAESVRQVVDDRANAP